MRKISEVCRYSMRNKIQWICRLYVYKQQNETFYYYYTSAFFMNEIFHKTQKTHIFPENFQCNIRATSKQHRKGTKTSKRRERAQFSWKVRRKHSNRITHRAASSGERQTVLKLSFENWKFFIFPIKKMLYLFMFNPISHLPAWTKWIRLSFIGKLALPSEIFFSRL